MTVDDGEVWLKPEFKDRRDELIALQDAARIANVAVSTVSSWRARFDNFPQPVLVFADRSQKLIHEGEFRDWYARFEATRGRKRPERRAVAAVKATIPTDRDERLAKLTQSRQKRDRLILQLQRLNSLIDQLADALISNDSVGGTT